MKITAQDLKSLGVIDRIISEPVGGAHRHPEDMIKTVGAAIVKELESFENVSSEDLISRRREKFLKIGRSLKP